MAQKPMSKEEALRNSLDGVVEMLNEYAAMFENGEFPPMSAQEGMRHIASLINLATIHRQDTAPPANPTA